MANAEIDEIKRLFVSRLDTLAHILSAGARHVPDFDPLLQRRLAPDMLPLGAQVAFACNQPRGFARWCAGQPIENLGVEVDTQAQAQAHIADTRERAMGISTSDAKLDEVKRIGLGPGRYCELPGRQYVADYLVPNFYFHLTTAYALLRGAGVPIGKADFMPYLAPHVRTEA